MADPPSSGSSSKGSGFTRKVGPLPIWGWAAIGFGVYYWYTHYGPGAPSNTTAAGAGTGGGSLRIGNITLTQTGRGRGRTTTTTGGGGTDHDKTPGGPKPKRKPPQKCPKGYFWDPDDNGGKGRCVKTAGHKGPDTPGSDNATAVRPGSSSGGLNPGGTAIKGPGGTGTEPRPPTPPGRRTPGPRVTRTTTSGGTGGSQQVIVIPPEGQPAQTGGPVNAQTGAPIYYEWEHAHRGPEVAEPVEAYAPGTSGATYGPGTAGAAVSAADLASQAAG